MQRPMEDTQEITCITCPVGCRMTVTLTNREVTGVAGNACRRGETYARQECVAPLRMVTAVAQVIGSSVPVSVKTESPVPKDKIMAAMREIESRDFRMPILMGDVLIENVAGPGVTIIATKSII